MRASVHKRLAGIELARAATVHSATAKVDFSVFSDAELERLDGYAERRLAWSGRDEDWLRTGLTDEERHDIDALQGKLDRGVI